LGDFDGALSNLPAWNLAVLQPVAWRISFLLVVWLGSQELVRSQPSQIRHVSVSGTERHLHLETKAGELLERSRVVRDVKRLWETGWFDDIRVLKDSSAEGTTVRFVLKERPRYLLRKVRFEPRRFEFFGELVPGTFVDRVSLERTARTLQDRLRDSGYDDATVLFMLSRVGIREADVVLRVNEGKRTVVRKLEVFGPHPADLRQVARELRPVQPRTLLPGLPRIWSGWKLRPPLEGV